MTLPPMASRTRATRDQIFVEDQDVAEGAAVHGRRRARGHDEAAARVFVDEGIEGPPAGIEVRLREEIEGVRLLPAVLVAKVRAWGDNLD